MVRGKGGEPPMKFGIVGTVSFLILAILLPGLAGAAAPSNYDECILESMKGVKSDLAAKSIIRSCRNIYPEGSNRKPNARGGSAILNSLRAVDKWLSALVMPPPRLALAG